MCDCVSEFECEEDTKNILRYAKNRVKGNAIIAATEFDYFDEFELHCNAQFKPVKDHLQLNHKISFMMQTNKESVAQLRARAINLKIEYALYVTYKAQNEKLLMTRMSEAETLVTKHFFLGLEPEMKINIRSEPKTLIEAIGFAEAAATAAGLAEV